MTSFPIPVRDEEYRSLLRNGICGSGIMCDNGAHYTDPRVRGWLEEMEERAARDGLRLGRYAETAGAGSFAFPGVWLVEPGGQPYPFLPRPGEWISNEGWERTILPAMEADWGDALATARTRSGVASPLAAI